ncbi:MAG: HD domain-containing protein [Acidimicrobiia bacterium]|nr:HD domain-containing protein [Acidimicrobiia bacterium]
MLWRCWTGPLGTWMADQELPGRAPDLFLDLRRQFATQRPPGGGREICDRLAAALDQLIAGLAGDEPSYAVAAVGGYGRGEMCLGSDIDLMTIHAGRPDPAAVSALLYPLWDAKLVVGHASRTVREVAAAGRDSMETLSALMTMRFVTGDGAIYEEAVEAVKKLVKQQSGRISEVLQSEEVDRRRAEPYWLLAADLKQGRGGLRTLQAVALDRSRSGADGEPIAPVVDELLDVRNAIQAVSGFEVRKPGNRYTFEVREAVAAWLGQEVIEVGTRLQAARRTAEWLADHQFPRLGTSPDPVAGVGRWLVRALRRPSTETYSSAFAQAAGALDGRAGASFSPSEEQAIRTAGPPLWSDGDRALFVRLLAAGDHGRAIVERLHDFGWLAKAIPEWVESVDRPHLVPFHAYTVGGHHWSTVDEILSLIDDDDPLLTAITDELGSVDDLLVAGFFHDIGKSRPGDHSTVGAEMMGTFTGRAHYGLVSRRRLGDAVRLHLLIPDSAVGRDIDDRAVIREIGEQIGDHQLLRLLYLLSIADARSTGPHMLTAWKANLMRQLFQRVEEQLTGSTSEVAESTIVEAAGGSIGPGRVSAFLASMPSVYTDRFSVEEIAQHLHVTSPPPRQGEIRWSIEHLSGATSLVLAALDQPGLIVRVAGTLASYGVEILDARLVTSDTGVGVDTFHLQDALQGGPVAEAKLAQVRRDLTTGSDYLARLDERRRHYGSTPRGGEVMSYRDGPGSVVEVRALDRIGLLHDVAAVISATGASIHLAKIRSRGDLAIETLWLRDPLTGAPLGDDRLEAIARKLTAALQSS